ncbi:hypothetical protein ACIHFD_49365 [Nonomuraea sp. NPDC051941]|uniref:hypothetical protein n=1 Tax=Nonomuraea sp. NPDC051941 TaxID=3364373 RepID=UPI0037CAEC32
MTTVTPEQVAIHAGLPLPLSEDALPAVEEAIADGYREVVAYLGRPAVPATFTQRGVAAGPDGWLLDQDPVLEVLSAVPEVDQVSGAPTGGWTITYRAGLDPEQDLVYGQALMRYVIAAAVTSKPVRRLAQNAAGARIITRVNVEGQGVEYETSGAASGSGAAGASPTLDTLEQWQRVVVSQRPGIGPHPAQTGAAWLL